MNKDSFVFHREWFDAIKELNDSTRFEIYEAIMAEAFDLDTKNLSPLAQMAMTFIRQRLNNDKEKYESICRRNSTNGSKGGRPKKTQNNPNNPVGILETQENPKNPEKPKKADTDIDIQDTNVSMSIEHNNIEKDTDVSKKKKNGNVFVPPTLADVEAYIKEKGFHFNAKDFIDYYEADDWHYGKDRKKVSNWKRCCLTWEQKRKNDNSSLFAHTTDVTNDKGETMLIPPEWKYIGEDGKHYESIFDMTRQQNSYEEYFEQYGNYK